MIKINLLGDETVIDHSKTLFLVLYGLSFVAVSACCFLFHTFTSGRIGRLHEERDTLKVKLEALKEVTKEVRMLEEKKKELKGKLNTMEQLKKAKAGPVRLLSDLNDSVPARSWLMRMEEKGKEFTLKGVALDDETTASFMQSLEKSNHIAGVELDETSLIDLKGAKVKEFSMRAKVNYSGEDSEKKPAGGPASTVAGHK